MKTKTITKTGEKMSNTKNKELRIKILNNMKTSTVFIPNSAGKFTVYTVVWKKNTYTGLSPNHTISKIQGVQ